MLCETFTFLYQLAVQDQMVKRVKLAQLVKASACQGGIYSLNLILRINLWGDFSKVQAHWAPFGTNQEDKFVISMKSDDSVIIKK